MKINGDDTHPPVVFDIAMEALAHRKVGHVRSLTYYSIYIYPIRNGDVPSPEQTTRW